MAINAGTIYSELILKADKYFANLHRADKETKSFEDKLKNFGNSSANVSQKFGDLGKTFGNISEQAGKVGKSLTTSVTLPIVGIATAASMVGISFKQKMAEVQAISGATGKEFDDLGNLAKELGSKTKYSASEVADGMKFMSMAGWSAQQTMAGLPAVLNLAIASGEELGTTSDIVTIKRWSVARKLAS